jgi:hypothetical protein
VLLNEKLFESPSHGNSRFAHNQAVRVLSEVGECDIGLVVADADGADERARPIFLLGQVVFDPGEGLGFGNVGFAAPLEHRPAPRLAAIDTAAPATPSIDGSYKTPRDNIVLARDAAASQDWGNDRVLVVELGGVRF